MHVRWLALLVLVGVAACKSAGSGGTPKLDLDADPLALLPPAALGVATLDMQGVTHAGPAGASLAAVADAMIPLGIDAGLVPSRDVDRIVIGAYAAAGADTDLIAVVSGRFDPDKIGRVARTRAGAPIVAGRYVGFTTYTLGALVYAPLTPRTLVAGTADGVRRLLDRVQTGNLQRALPAWVVDTLETKGAHVAAAADFTTRPIGTVTLGSVSIPWLNGVRVARVLGDMSPPGINVAATLTYGDATQASAAAEGVQLLAGWLKMLGPLVGGATVQNVDVRTEGADLLCKFAVDEQALRMLLSLAPRLLSP